MSALLGGLGYVLPLLAFCGLAAVLIGLLWPWDDRDHRDARQRNHARRRWWR